MRIRPRVLIGALLACSLFSGCGGGGEGTTLTDFGFGNSQTVVANNNTPLGGGGTTGGTATGGSGSTTGGTTTGGSGGTTGGTTTGGSGGTTGGTTTGGSGGTTGGTATGGSGGTTGGTTTGGSGGTTITPPNPALFRLGNGVAPLHYAMTAWTLNDVMKAAGFESESDTEVRASEMWVPIVAGEFELSQRYNVVTDTQGWPLSLTLDNGTQADRLTTLLLASDVPGAQQAGTYQIRYEGSGQFALDGATIVSQGPGAIDILYTGNDGILFSITETDPAGNGDYLRNIRCYRPGADPSAIFSTDYLEFIRPFAVIRPLHLLGEEGPYAFGGGFDFSQRKPFDHSHWGGAIGAPYELAARMANESQSDLWFNIPLAANDEFVRQLAQLLLQELDPQRALYLELGNELWNFSYPYSNGRAYALEQARLRWPGVEGNIRTWSNGEPVTEPMMVHSWQGARTAEIAAIFREVWGDQSPRIVVTLCGQIGASVPSFDNNRFILETPVLVGEESAAPAWRSVDAFAVAPYIGEEVGSIEFDRSSLQAFFTEATEYVRGEGAYTADAAEPGLRYAIRSDRALAAEFQLPLVAYEGGQHFLGSTFTRDEVNVSPLMYDLYRAYFDVWREEGGGLFVHFAGLIPRGQNEPGTEPGYFESENFGIKETQTQTEAEAPKWRAVLDEMREIGQISATP